MHCNIVYEFHQYDETRPSVCNWPAVVPGCGGAAPSPAPAPAVTTTSATPPVTTPAPDTEETEVTTEAAAEVMETTAEAETEAPYRPAAGSAYQCSGPGIFNDKDNCNKFWLCKEEPADSGVLQVDTFIVKSHILYYVSTMRRYGYS